MSEGVIIQDVIEKKQPPNGVKLISILFCMSAARSLLDGYAKLIGGSDTVRNTPIILQFISTNALWMLLLIWRLIEIPMFLLIGRGLWKGNNSMRYTAIILCIAGVTILVLKSMLQPDSSTMSIIKLVTRVIVNTAFIYYLINENTKKYFKKVKAKK